MGGDNESPSAPTASPSTGVSIFTKAVDSFKAVSMSLFGTLEEPKYETMRTYSGDGIKIEVRKYAAAKWVSNRPKESADKETGESNHSDRSRDLFMPLFNYIGGTNAQGKKIEMTRPVSSVYAKSDDGENMKCVEMGFYLNSENQENPPLPTTEGLSIADVPERMIMTATFTNRTSSPEQWEVNRTKLVEAIRKIVPFNEQPTALQRGSEFDPTSSSFQAAGYNPPFEFFNLRNEVWIPMSDSQ